MKSLVFIVLIVISITTTPVSAFEADPLFHSPVFENFGGEVNASVTLPDGKIVLAGEFLSWDGVTRGSIVLLDSDGRIDPDFTTDIRLFSGPGTVRKVIPIIDENELRLFIAGSFDSVNNTDISGVAMLNLDGTLDTNFNPGVGGAFIDAELLPDQSIVLLPDVQRRIHKILLNGNRVSSFDVSYASSGDVSDIELQNETHLILAGRDITINDQAWRGLARLNLDGSIDTSFTGLHDSTDENFMFIKLLTGATGEIYATSNSKNVLGSGSDHIVRLASTGALDPTFQVALSSPPAAMHLFDQTLLIGGQFSMINSETLTTGLPYVLGKLNLDGSTDDTFTLIRDFTATLAITISANEIVLAGRPHSRFIVFAAETPTARRYSSAGLLDTSFQSSGELTLATKVRIDDIEVLEDNKLLIAGDFARIDKIPRIDIARLNSDGTVDPDFQIQGVAASEFGVLKIARQADGKILLRGERVDEDLENGLVRMLPNGELDGSFANSGFTSDISSNEAYTMTQDDRILVAGRQFPILEISLLDTQGQIDESFNVIRTSRPFGINALLTVPGDKALAIGRFSDLNDEPRDKIALFDSTGQLDDNFSITVSTASSRGLDMQAVTVLPDGAIIIRATSVTDRLGNTREKLIRVEQNGLIDLGFNPSTADITYSNFAPQCDNKLVVFRQITSNGSRTLELVRLLKDGNPDPSFGDQTDTIRSVSSSQAKIAFDSNANIILGTTVRGGSRVVLQRLISVGNENIRCYTPVAEELCVVIPRKTTFCL